MLFYISIKQKNWITDIARENRLTLTDTVRQIIQFAQDNYGGQTNEYDYDAEEITDAAPAKVGRPRAGRPVSRTVKKR